MEFLDFFAGVGGFRRGLELAGHKCVGFCEWDRFARASYVSMHLLTDEQREALAKMDLKTRQKEILKEEYRNGEWMSADIRNVEAGSMPLAGCWCFGAPCQDFSIAGKRAGLGGDRSSLVREIFRILRETPEKDRPKWLIYENVKGMLSSNAGRDYLEILMEMDDLGYDVEWQVLNSADWGVPQNRERVYTVGHFRGGGTERILPILPADGADRAQIDLIGNRKNYRRNTQIFAPDGIVEALDTAAGGGRGHYTAVRIINKDCKHMHEAVHDQHGVASTLLARDYKDAQRVVMPILTPDRIEKRQNGRRIKDDGEAAFTLTTTDIHGVCVEVKEGEDEAPASVWYEPYQCRIAIRKLTPRECFRLQGWDDEYFERAAFVNSKSQLYKQAGNGVTVSVVCEIGKAIKQDEERRSKCIE